VPPGTVISTDVPNGPIYTTDIAVLLPASASSVPFSATCKSDGAGGNVSAAALPPHNFQGYTDFRFGTLLVTNSYGIVTGSDIESDDNYRYRISLRLGSKNGAAEADLRLAILNVPGIQDLVFVRQAGTYLCYVYASSPLVPTGVMQMVQNQMNQATAWPIVGRAVQPDLIGISLATTLTFVAGATSSQQQSAISNATAAAENYLNNLAVGQTMVINQVADRILSADQNILTTGTPNQPLNGIYIWRSREDGTRYSRFLVSDYTPVVGERIGVESSILNPINLTVAA